MGNNRKVLIIAILALLTLCLCISCFLIVYFFNSQPSIDPETKDFSEIPIEQYLGYEQYSIVIEDNTDVVNEVRAFYEDMQDVAVLENQLKVSAEDQDADEFFSALSSYNQLLFKQTARALSLAQFVDGNTDTDPVGDLPFILNVKAKERFSYWYYVPIIGSILKGKHQSIETSRSGVYEYMSKELTISEQKEFLNEYGLDSLEDIKQASDNVVEKLARDPELRAGINWTKIATDLGENAVIATTESIKIGPSRNPALSTVINGAVRIFTKSGQDVPDSMPVSVLVPDSVVESIDQIMPEQQGNGIEEISLEELNSLNTELSAMNMSMVAINSAGEESQYIESGTWNSITAMLGALPVAYEFEVQEQKVSEINIPIVDTSTNLLDPLIAMNLGFDVVVENKEIPLTSCLDLSGGISLNSSAEKTCKDDYEYCKRNQYTISGEYSSCISAGGGCWDIGRWEYMEENNCPIDAEFNLNYDDRRLQSDYEYFGTGNKAYCECIVECRQQYWVKKDCNEQLRSCCESITN